MLPPPRVSGRHNLRVGVARNVIVHDVGASNQFIQRVETFTTQVDVGMIDVNVVLGGNAAKSASARLSFAFPGSPSRTLTLPVKNGVAQLTNVTVPNPRPWTLDDPNLHNMTVTLESSGDSVVVRFGLRVVSAVGGRIAINGKAVKLHGVNRHTLWPDTGAAVTLEQIKADVALLRELGANYVRGAHYPQVRVQFPEVWLEFGCLTPPRSSGSTFPGHLRRGRYRGMGGSARAGGEDGQPPGPFIHAAAGDRCQRNGICQHQSSVRRAACVLQ